MTAPIRPPPKSLDGRSARELFAFERVVDDGDPVPPAGRVGGVPDVALPIADGNLLTVLLKQPAAATDYWPRQRPWFDTRAFTHVRVITDVHAVGAFGAEVFAEMSATPDDAGSWVAAGATGTNAAVSIDNTGPQKGGWVALAATGDFAWRAQAREGDASLTPVLGKVHFQFRQATATAPPNVNPPGDFPEPIWWAKSGDLMFTDPSGTIPNPGTNGSDVSFWGDKTGNGWSFLRGVIGSPPTLDTTELDPRGNPAVAFSTDRYFTQNSGAVAGLNQCTCFIVKRHVDETPLNSERSGIWHYGRRIGSNDAAHPYSSGVWWESFGQGFHVNLNIFGTPNHTDNPAAEWHVWGVRRDGAAGKYSVWYNTDHIAVPPMVGGTSPNTWPIEGAATALLGRSLSHHGLFFMTEIIAYDAYFTDAQMIAKANELLGT